MTPKLSDRVLSVIAYYTFGIFSIIWIVFASVAKKKISKYLYYNLYQAIVLSLVFAFISLVYDVAINFLSTIPFIGKLAIAFDLFINKTPLYFTFTITGFLIMFIISLMSLICIIGRAPRLPFISDIIKENFSGGSDY